jgi:hypothetical protein
MEKNAKNQLLWVEAQKRYHLSDSTIQMAKALGLNPKKLGGIANHKQEHWKSGQGGSNPHWNSS